MTAEAPAARPVRTAAACGLALLLLAGVLVMAQRLTAARPALLDVAMSPPVAAPPAESAPRVAGRVRGATSAVPTIDPAWLQRTAVASGISATALQAYARAELRAPASCHLGWTTLAGVGWIESQHGTYGGRTLQDDGYSSTPILGPALDGTHRTQAIAATPETTALHGDPAWDHAVGPLQFIPSTWEAWAVDGDGDGVSDPNDIDDAALAAADYLCADGRDLATAAGWTAAILSYNRSRTYLDDVHAAATTYATRTA